MNTDRWPRVKEIFLATVQREPHERAAFLDETCGHDQDLRREVEGMLSSYEDSKDFLELPTKATLLPDEPEEPPSFDRIGPYLIQKVISAGGMGTVYEALQENPSRTVAVKVMSEGIASKTALRRFEYESQILASLRHPNIAQVIEAGTHREEGRDKNGGMPYFVMEYIEGAQAITDFAWEKKLSVSERMKLFLPVCDAVHHGHQKGIIHRDLKPSNLLVDASGKVKIIDFGVARATDSDLSLTTAQTDMGQLIGTLQYMSPEQCRADPNDLDIRSDVYALGVVLYELLCEELPYDVRKAMVFEATRVIREAQPKKPSATKRALRGDAETIVLKALEKERVRRYQTVADLGADIRRFLQGEVILAKPAGPATRAWKRAKRHPVLSTALGMALFAAFVFLGYILFVSYPQIRHERDVAEEKKKLALAAEQEAVKARSEAELQFKAALRAKTETEIEAENTKLINEFLEEMLSSADPFKEGGSIKLVGMLDRAAERIDREFPDRPEIEASLRSTLGATYKNNGLLESAYKQLRIAREIYGRIHGEEHPNTLNAKNNLASILSEQGEYNEAESVHREVLETCRRVLGEEDPLTLTSMNNLATVLMRKGEYIDAESMLREALEGFHRVLGEEHSDTLQCMNNLAGVLRDQGKYLEAETILREAVEISRHVRGEEHPHTLILLGNLADQYIKQGQYSEAETVFQKVIAVSSRVLGEEHTTTIKFKNELALVFKNQGRYSEAESIYRETPEILCRVLGDEHPDTLKSMSNLANWLGDQGKYSEAESLHRKVLEIRRRVLSEEHPDKLMSMNNLANVLKDQGKLDQAESLHRKVLEIRRRVLSEEHPDTLLTMNNLANVLKDQGKLDQAESLHRDTLEARCKVLSEEHPDTLKSMNNLANVLRAQGKYSEAESLHQEVLEIRRRILGEEHPDTLRSMNNLANVLWVQGKPSEAELLFRDILEVQRRDLGENHPSIIGTINNLASVLRDQGKLSEAEPLMKQGIEMAERVYPKPHPLKAMLLVNYGKLLTMTERYEEAEDPLIKGYRGYKITLGENHDKTRYALKYLINLYESWGKPDKAAEWRVKLTTMQ